MTACLVEQFEQFVVNNMRVKLLEFTLSSMVQGLKANKNIWTQNDRQIAGQTSKKKYKDPDHWYKWKGVKKKSTFRQFFKQALFDTF